MSPATGRLAGKVCVVTGAGTGIGRATALEMAREGGTVVVSDVDDEHGAETLKLLGQISDSTEYIHCDVSQSEATRDLMAATVARFGGLDVLHNNAGVIETQLTDSCTLETLPEEIWERVFAVNVKGTYLCCRHAAPYLREAATGAIVNCASVSAYAAHPTEIAYGATKAAIVQLTRSIALEMAPDGVRCNCYSPAEIDTRLLREHLGTEADEPRSMGLLRRWGRPEEVAKLVCFLASDDATLINGAAYLIDGGALARLP